MKKKNNASTDKSGGLYTSKRKLVLFVGLAVLLIGASSFALVKMKPGADAANDSNKAKQAEVAKNQLADDQKQKLQSQYDEQKQAVTELEALPADQQKSLYTGMAFKAARLRDPQAREHAAKALSLMTEEQRKNEAGDQVIKDLKTIEAGNADDSFLAAVSYTTEE